MGEGLPHGRLDNPLEMSYNDRTFVCMGAIETMKPRFEKRDSFRLLGVEDTACHMEDTGMTLIITDPDIIQHVYIKLEEAT